MFSVIHRRVAAKWLLSRVQGEALASEGSCTNCSFSCCSAKLLSKAEAGLHSSTQSYCLLACFFLITFWKVDPCVDYPNTVQMCVFISWPPDPRFSSSEATTMTSFLLAIPQPFCVCVNICLYRCIHMCTYANVCGF